MRKRAAAASLVILGSLLSVLPACSLSSGDGIAKKANSGAPEGTGFVTRSLSTNGRKYTVFIPHAYTSQKKWPVIMFLHGMGEGGSDGTKNLTVGLGPTVAERASTFPFIVIFPQSMNGDWNENSGAAADAIEALREVKKAYAVDEACVALTGLSHGGYGTWAIGAKYASEFSALAPMCSEPSYKDVDALSKFPGIWGFSFSGDPFVPAMHTTGMVDAINKAGGRAKADVYPALGHAVWHQAYENPELYSWILTCRRSPAVATPGYTAPGKTPAKTEGPKAVTPATPSKSGGTSNSQSKAGTLPESSSLMPAVW